MVYLIPDTPLPWLYPCLEIAGILLQTIAIIARSRLPILFGLALVGTGCFFERDLALFVGDCLLTCAITMYTRQKK